MAGENFLKMAQLSFELACSKPVIHFIMDRFKSYITVYKKNGRELFSIDDIFTFMYIIDLLKKGVLPSEIEKKLKDFNKISNSFNKPLDLLEQRKTEALEKRAEAEMRKAIAMENSNEQLSAQINAINSIAKAVSELTISLPVKEESISGKSSYSDIQYDNDTKNKQYKVEIDDLSLLINNKEDEKIEVDDLSLLINNKEDQKIEIDDLSLLIDSREDPKIIIDDLSRLINNTSSENSENFPTDIDDLSRLLDNDDPVTNYKIDDLSALIDNINNENESIDDLSLLTVKNDDDFPEIKKPEFSPEDDFEKYKSEIINTIIDLKDKGISEERTCEKFNELGIVTFSGKTKWSVKTISQIYQLIENAA